MIKIRFENWEEYKDFIIAFNSLTLPRLYVYSLGFDFVNKVHCFEIKAYGE